MIMVYYKILKKTISDIKLIVFNGILNYPVLRGSL